MEELDLVGRRIAYRCCGWLPTKPNPDPGPYHRFSEGASSAWYIGDVRAKAEP